MNTEIAKLLESDHDELDALLRQTYEALDLEDSKEAYLKLDLFWARLAMHIRAEHLCLFPAVRGIVKQAENSATETGIEDIPPFLDQLRSDHDFFIHQLARAVKAMRLVFYFGNEAETIPIVRDLLDQVSQRLIEHNSLEEGRVYTLTAEPFISRDAAAGLTILVKKELANLPPRFRTVTAAS